MRLGVGDYVRMLLMQTRMNFTWYLVRDGEMVFWSLAMPVFFLLLFTFAFQNSDAGSKFLVPGLIGAQVFSAGFWGVGVQLATFREKHLLRRVYLTPLPPAIFFASLVLYRLTLLVLQAAILTFVGLFIFHVHITGNFLTIVFVLALGAATFVALGTLIGALAKTTESANNFASVFTVPLSFLSDAYIPIDRFPHAVSSVLHMLPSTQFVDMLRGVTTGGQSLGSFSAWLVALGLWTAAGTLLSARLFKWI